MRDNSTMHFLERLELDQMENDWTAPDEFPDLTNCKYIAIDLETRDPNLKKLGPGWTRNDGYVVGIAIAGGDFVGAEILSFAVRASRSISIVRVV